VLDLRIPKNHMYTVTLRQTTIREAALNLKCSLRFNAQAK
jgi:hypothetical protein